jgi:hypothetical protein
MSGERFDPLKMYNYLPLDAVSSDVIVCISKETVVSSVSDSSDKEVITISPQASQLSSPLLHTRTNSNPESSASPTWKMSVE